MRIAHLTCVWPPYPGGIGRVAYEIASRQASNHTVEVFTPLYKDVDRLEIDSKFTVNYLSSIFRFGKAAVVSDILEKIEPFDVIHLHYPWFGVHEFLNKLNKKSKLVVTYHMSAQSQGWKQILFSLDNYLFAKKLAKRADCLLVATDDYSKNIAQPRLGHVGKWQVLPFGVDERYYPEQASTELLKQLGFSNEDKILIFVGTLDKAHEFKGLSVLLKSLQLIADDKLKLLVVGEGELKNYYQEQANKLHLSDRVKFAGFVPEPNLPDYYRMAKVFVFPSVTNAEAFGLVALQAMACGLPVIASDLVGVRQLIRPNINGLLVSPNNAKQLAETIDKLINNTDLRINLGQMGRQMILEKYQWDDIVEGLDKIYKGL